MAARVGSLGPFVGRDRILQEVEGAFTAGERLVTITGAGGMGKSRLAREIASRSGAAIVCELHEAADLDSFADAIAAACGIARASGERLFDRLGDAIAAKGDVLLVLDGFDRLVPLGPSSVPRLLERAPEARLLVSSRERLALEGEVVFELSPLAIEDQSVELLRAIARRAGRSAESSDDLEALAEIARAMEGIPLALELAACRLSVMGPRALAHRLSSGLDVLRRVRRDGPSRHETLETAVEWSWSLLRPFERDALVQCALFRGGFAIDAAEAVLDLSRNAGAPPVIDAIASLRDRSLLRASEPVGLAGEVRLSLFDCVREFATRQLADSGLERGAVERHTRHFVAKGVELAREVERGVEARRRLALERENLLSVVERAMSAGPITAAAAEPALEALLALAPVLLSHGPLQSYVRMLDPAVEAMKGSGADPRLLARALALRGAVRELHDASGLADVRLALLIAQKVDDRALEAEVTVQAARLFAERGEIDAARAHHARAIELEPDGPAALGLAAHLASREGDGAEARRLHERALRAFGADGRKSLVAEHRLRLAEIELFDGRIAEARAHLAQAARVFAELDDPAGEAATLGYRGFADHLAGDLLAAREAYEEAGRRLDERGFRAPSARSYGLLGVLAREEGRLAEAHARLTDAVRTLDRGPWLACFRAHLAALDGAPIEAPAVAAFATLAERCGRIPESDAPIPAADMLVAPADGDWFRAPNGRPVSLRNRKPLRRLLARLIERHVDAPGSPLDHAELVSAGWPDEKVLPDAAAQRLRVAIATLRRLGLKDTLATAPSGYLIDPRVRAHVIGS